jgi:hypothetical protein
MFIESAKVQAEAICEITKKPVFSVEELYFFRNNNANKNKKRNLSKINVDTVSNKVRKKLKGIIKKIKL